MTATTKRDSGRAQPSRREKVDGGAALPRLRDFSRREVVRGRCAGFSCFFVNEGGGRGFRSVVARTSGDLYFSRYEAFLVAAPGSFAIRGSALLGRHLVEILVGGCVCTQVRRRGGRGRRTARRRLVAAVVPPGVPKRDPKTPEKGPKTRKSTPHLTKKNGGDEVPGGCPEDRFPTLILVCSIWSETPKRPQITSQSAPNCSPIGAKTGPKRAPQGSVSGAKKGSSRSPPPVLAPLPLLCSTVRTKGWRQRFRSLPTK